MTNTRESRPEGIQAAEKTFSGGNTPSVSAGTHTAAVALVTGVHVVVVETSAGRYRRRVYFNLPSAQLAADRAAMAGHPASVILCQLMPVTGGAA